MNAGSGWTRSLKVVFPVVVLAALLVLPAAGLSANMVRMLFATAVWTITSVGWNLLGGFAGQVSFGFAVFYGLGAYTAALLINGGVNPYIAFLGGAGTAAAASFLIGLPTFRLRGPYFVIATIAVTEAVRVIMNNLDFTGGASGYRIVEQGEFRPLEHYYTAVGALAIAVAISILISRSRFGLALRAIKQDEDAAADIGVRPYASKLWVHAVAAALTGIAGGIYARRAAFIHPGDVFSFQTGVSILLMPIIGGIGTVWGAVLGGAVYGLVEQELLAYFPETHLLLYGGLLILIILLEPGGIVGLAQRLWRRTHGDSGGHDADQVLWGRGGLARR